MRNGLPRVRQHLVPVVPAQAVGADPHAADSYDLVVAHSEGETKGPPGVGDQTCSQKGGPRSLGLCPAECRALKGRGVPAAVTLCPASSGGQWTRADEREVVNAFEVSGNGG